MTILRGNLVDLAVAVIIGTSFGVVVATSPQPRPACCPRVSRSVFDGSNFGSVRQCGDRLRDLQQRSCIFFVVLPYTKLRDK
ncbi:MAG: MscL family protein [Marmoricola sp.]